MKARLPFLVLLVPCLFVGTQAADDTDKDADKKSEPKESMRSRLLEDAKSKAAKPAPPAVAATAAKSDKPEPPAPATPPPATPPTPKDNAKTAAEPAAVLPKVEVNKSRITELDVQIQRQEQDIAREKEHAKPTELDKALNNAEVSHALRIFGGESSQQRETVASERVRLMEDERDILEAMKLAKTKEEKKKLQSQLDELRAYRRDLEKNLR